MTLLLAACATSGKKIDPNDVQGFVVGKTTLADVEAKLGQPTRQTTSSDGTTIVDYAYAHSQAKGESFIPFAGAFVGGADSQTQSTMFTFDSAGKLKSYTQSSGQHSTGTGLSNGQAQ